MSKPPLTLQKVLVHPQRRKRHSKEYIEVLSSFLGEGRPEPETRE